MTSGRSCPLRHVRAGDKRGRQIHHVSRARGSVRLLSTSNISHLAHATPHRARLTASARASVQASKGRGSRPPLHRGHDRGIGRVEMAVSRRITKHAHDRKPKRAAARPQPVSSMQRRGLNLKRARAAVRLRLRLTLSAARAAVSPRAPGAAHPSRPRDARHDVQANGTTVATPIKRGTRGARDGALP